MRMSTVQGTGPIIELGLVNCDRIDDESSCGEVDDVDGKMGPASVGVVDSDGARGQPGLDLRHAPDYNYKLAASR